MEVQPMKAAVIYASVHHRNTKKVLDAMRRIKKFDLIKASDCKKYDFKDYGIIGFASGIYAGDFHRSVRLAIKGISLERKKVFLVYTCGMRYRDHAKHMKKIIAGKGGSVCGEFYCRGFDTFGPFKIVGGIAKNHPSSKDLEQAAAFIKKLPLEPRT